MVRALGDETDPARVAAAIDNIARYMRAKSFEYNQEHPNNEVIVKDLRQMSEGAIRIDETALNNLRSDYKQHFSAPSRPKGLQPRNNRPQQKKTYGGNFRKNDARYRNLPK